MRLIEMTLDERNEYETLVDEQLVILDEIKLVYDKLAELNPKIEAANLKIVEHCERISNKYGFTMEDVDHVEGGVIAVNS